MSATASSTVSLAGPAALRAFARAFGQFDDFDRFVAGIQAALDRSPRFAHSLIALDRSIAAPVHFPSGTLSFPLVGEAGTVGTLQVAATGERRQFGSEDLHLLAGLADFLSAVLAQSQRAQDATRGRELLRLLLNQAPVGIAAYGLDRRPIVANESAARWLGHAPLPFEDFEAGADQFHLRADGKLVYGEARRLADAGGAWIVVLHDLTPDQSKLLDGMHRELFRALAHQAPCSIALIESTELRQGVLHRLPALRATLGSHEIAGPYDVHRVAVVLASGGLAVRARLRQLHAVFAGLPELRLGYAELGRDGRAPDTLLGAAIHRHRRFEDVLQPAVLVQDENPGVADTLAMVLGRDFRVVKSSNASHTRTLLAAEPFEAIIAELEPRTGISGVELAREASELQPGIQPFLTAIGDMPLPAAMNAIVIPKPFDVSELTQLVRAKIGH